MLKKLLLYGLQRSGTNFLEAVLNKSFPIKCLNDKDNRNSPMHKHFRLYDQKNFIPEPKYKNNLHYSDFLSFTNSLDEVPDYFFVISKNPYSWLISYRNWGEKCHWPSVNHHYISEYYYFYNKWMEFSLQSDRIIFIRYMDLLSNLEKELKRLKRLTGLHKKIKLINKNYFGQVPQSKSFTESRLRYYLNEEYLELFTKQELMDINHFIGPDLISFLGYEKISV